MKFKGFIYTENNNIGYRYSDGTNDEYHNSSKRKNKIIDSNYIIFFNKKSGEKYPLTGHSRTNLANGIKKQRTVFNGTFAYQNGNKIWCNRYIQMTEYLVLDGIVYTRSHKIYDGHIQKTNF